ARGLSSRGYTVLQAGNGVEAIEVLDQHEGKIDLVVSDVVMPEMDGPALLKELRRRKPDLEVIFVSGYAEEAFAANKPEEKFAFLAKAVGAQDAGRQGQGDDGVVAHHIVSHDRPAARAARERDRPPQGEHRPADRRHHPDRWRHLAGPRADRRAQRPDLHGI